MAFTRISENSEREEVGGGVMRTKFYPRAMWLDDVGSWVGKKRSDLTDQDTRIELPGGHWVESKRSLARFLIGKGADTRFNVDVKMETVGGGNTNYSLDPEGRVITTEDVDNVSIEWSYSHKQGPTTYPSVFKLTLDNGDLGFQFTAPTDATYRLFVQVTPVIGGVAASQLMTNKQGQVYGANWLLDTSEILYFAFPNMAGQLNEVDTELLGDTLFLYSQDYPLLTGEGFNLG